MASSSKNRSSSNRLINRSSQFVTWIDPNEGKINLPPEFCLDWFYELHQSLSYIISSCDKSHRVSLCLTDTDHFLFHGYFVSKTFGFDRTTKVLLDYEVQKKEFKMTVLSNEENEDEVTITELNDSESNEKVGHKNADNVEHEDPFVGEDEFENPKVCWIKKVTPSVARQTKRQVLHIPKEHAIGHFKNITEITLVSRTSDFNVKATIVTTKRSIKNEKRDEKQIEEAWFQYLRKHEMMVGDQLVFKVYEEDDVLFVFHEKTIAKDNENV